MRRTTLLLLFLAGSFATQAQTRQIQTESFNGISAYGPFRIRLVQADKEKVEIDYNGIDQDEVVIKSSDGELTLKLKSRHYWSDWSSNDSRNGRHAIVTVYFKKLEEIVVKAGSTVKSDNTISASRLTLICKMGAEMRLDIKANHVELDSGMGSDVELTGTTESVEIYSKMGSTVKAIRLRSEKALVRASMGSDVAIFASKEIDASAGFGASINFAGDPSVRNTSTSFGGEAQPVKR